MSVALPGLCACRIAMATPQVHHVVHLRDRCGSTRQRACHLDPRAQQLPRDYGKAALGRVQQIRELLNAGLSTQAIRAILPCLQSPRDPIAFRGVTFETVAALERERDSLTERIDILARNRHAIADYLAELQKRAA
ncbi:MerR family transcriptional regulator [Streptomyces mirabilis]|uniref:MerR family transcriptional regulator n=1 Tax=Streptomyces mirabilis TaxID=68239 RepID=UPI00368BF08C